jgi:hypothetical protein
VERESCCSPDEDVWPKKAVRSFGCVYARQSLEDVEQSRPKCDYIFPKRRRFDGPKEVFQCTAIRILQQDIVAVALSVTSQELYKALINFMLGSQPELLECINLGAVIDVGLLSIVRF